MSAMIEPHPLWSLTVRGVGGLSRRLLGLEFDALMSMGLSLVHRIPCPDKIYLTFDDSPHPATTPAILEALGRHSVKASFFVVGKRVEEYPDLLAKIAEAGHEIGNHSQSHFDMHTLSPAKLRQEVIACQRAVGEVTNDKPSLFRAPFGHFRWDMRDLRALDGITSLVHWDIAPYFADTSAESISRYVLERATAGSIILLNDGLYGYPEHLSSDVGRAAAAAVDLIVPALQKRGLLFAALPAPLRPVSTAVPVG